MDNQFLIAVYVKSKNLTILNTPVYYWIREGFEFIDPHWIAVMVMNSGGNETIDYLEYTRAKDSYSSLLNLPINDTIKFIA